MKTRNEMKVYRWVQLTALMLLAVSVLGCASDKKKKGDSSAPPVVDPSGPFVPPGNGPGSGPGGDWEYGGTTGLSIVSIATMSDYTGRPMNSPQNIKLNLNLVPTGPSSNTKKYWGGTVTIGYTDNGIYHQGSFTSGSSADATQLNVWFTSGGEEVFHAVFEDFMGGIVVVIDGVTDLGDGSDAQASGSVWYKNFGFTYAPHPPTYCWFVSLGPYDCRPWPADDDDEDYEDRNNTYASVLPQGGYKKLGNFSDLNLDEAFNGEL